MKTVQNAAIKPITYLAFFPTALVWMLILMLIGQGTFAAEQLDRNLVPSLISSESVPADSIARLAELVFVIAVAIFTGMGGLFACVVIFLRCQTKNDCAGSAAKYANDPVGVARTTTPLPDRGVSIADHTQCSRERPVENAHWNTLRQSNPSER